MQPFPERYVHLDVLVSVLAEKLAAVCVEELPSGGGRLAAREGLRDHRDLAEQAFTLGVNAISLGESAVLSTEGAELNEAAPARGLTVLDPDLSMFTLGGGGPHCLAQPLRRERLG